MFPFAHCIYCFQGAPLEIGWGAQPTGQSSEWSCFSCTLRAAESTQASVYHASYSLINVRLEEVHTKTKDRLKDCVLSLGTPQTELESVFYGCLCRAAQTDASDAWTRRKRKKVDSLHYSLNSHEHHTALRRLVILAASVPSVCPRAAVAIVVACLMIERLIKESVEPKYYSRHGKMYMRQMLVKKMELVFKHSKKLHVI